MKSKVSAFLMLLMVVSFVINAFAVVDQAAMNQSFRSLIPESRNGYLNIGGHTDGGRRCEVGISIDQNGQPGVMLSYETFMGRAHLVFDPAYRTLESFSDDGQTILISSLVPSRDNQKEDLTIVTALEGAQRVVKSVEIYEEGSGWFSSSTSTKCNIAY